MRSIRVTVAIAVATGRGGRLASHEIRHVHAVSQKIASATDLNEHR
jgi:hypothetical protein